MTETEFEKRMRDVEIWQARRAEKWEAHDKWVAKYEKQLSDLTKLLGSTRLTIAKASGATGVILLIIGKLLGKL